jgi:hypothetical protein
MELIQQPHQVIIVYSNDHEVRHVRMNAPHPAPVTPSWYGDSVGHYEGDALVVDTVGVKVGPYAMVDWYGTPHTAALHVVERYRLLDYADMIEAEERGTKETFRLEASDAGFARDPNDKGKGLQLQFTVEDQGVFTTPWTATMTYRRPLSPLGQWPEMVCAENPSGYFDGGKPRSRQPASRISECDRMAPQGPCEWLSGSAERWRRDLPVSCQRPARNRQELVSSGAED